MKEMRKRVAKQISFVRSVVWVIEESCRWEEVEISAGFN